MTYVKAIQSYDTQIENLEIKSEKTLALTFASIVMMVLLAIVHHIIGFDQYVTMLIRLCLEFYFIVIGYAFLLLTIYQGILEICRDFLLAKELFIRVTRRYGVKKGASSLIKKCAERCTNKPRSNTQNNPSQVTKIAPGNIDYKNSTKEKINNKNTKPGPKTPPELLNDIEKLIEELPQAYFHADTSKVKHTSAAKYALDPQKAEWFATKWNYSTKQIGKLIKKKFEQLNSS